MTNNIIIPVETTTTTTTRWLVDHVNGTTTTIIVDDNNNNSKTAIHMFSIVMSNLLLFFLIFGLSATVQIKTLRHQLTNKFAIFTGVAMQFLIMPVLGFIAVFLLRGSGFTQAMGISLLVVTASPGGSYSNWWCSVFNAELALSVAMTSVSSILSIALLPANLFFYTWLAYSIVAPAHGDEKQYDNVLQSLDFGAIFISLGVVMGAILLGLSAGYKYDNPTFHKRANGFGSFCGISLILFSAFLGSGVGEADTNYWSLPWSFYVGTAFPCIVGMTLANFLSRCFRLNPPECVAISIECCYQNTAIATSVAVTMFTDPNKRAEAISVPLFYGVVEAVIIFAYCVWAWKMNWTKAPANEKICVVVTKTYEVEDDHNNNNNNRHHRRHHTIEDGSIEDDVDDEDDNSSQGSKGCWGKMFEPRAQEQHHHYKEQPIISDTPIKNVDRARFNSVDETLATTPISPPTTPDMTTASSVGRPYDNRRIGKDYKDNNNKTGLENLYAPTMTPPRSSLIDVIREDGEGGGNHDKEDLEVPSSLSLQNINNDNNKQKQKSRQHNNNNGRPPRSIRKGGGGKGQHDNNQTNVDNNVETSTSCSQSNRQKKKGIETILEPAPMTNDDEK